MRKWTVELTERELRLILTAFDVCRQYETHASAKWWNETEYAVRLYERLRAHGVEKATT